jgi:hypothetical protein
VAGLAAATDVAAPPDLAPQGRHPPTAASPARAQPMPNVKPPAWTAPPEPDPLPRLQATRRPVAHAPVAAEPPVAVAAPPDRWPPLPERPPASPSVRPHGRGITSDFAARGDAEAGAGAWSA